MKSSLRKTVVGSAWGRWSLAAAIAAGMTLSFATSGQAAPSLDANVSQTVNTGSNSVFAFRTMAQTFTALHTGNLTQVDVFAGTNWSPTTLKIQVWNVANGNPISMASSVTVNGTLPFTPDWHGYPLANPVPVTQGDKYAIVAVAGLANYFRWGYNGTINYLGGSMLVLSGSTWTGFTSLAAGSAFNFRTYVDSSTSAPKAPVVGHDAPAASAHEGTAPAMTGTYSNPNGGTVNLKADHGTVTPSSGAGGAWSWSGDVYDETNAPSSVTITATDPATGLFATTAFPLSISAVNPTAGITTGAPGAAAASTSPLSRPEGSSVTLSGTASSPDPTDQAAGFSYTWTATRDGVALGSPATSPSYTVPVDEGTYVVTVQATDDGGMVSDPVSVTVNKTEITPTASITSIAPADPTLNITAPQETLNFSGTYSDPAPETHTYRWDFGDGASSASLNAAHAYAFAGTYTVTLTVKDDEGVANTATAHVTVQSTQQSLATMIAYVQSLSSLNKGQQNSLIAKLNAASDSSARGNNNAAHNQLNAFLNELDSDLKTGKITAGAYNTLRADTHAVQGALGTLNRFLEWWPPAA